MKIHLRFFAYVREQLGVSEETIDVPHTFQTVDDVRQYLVARGGVWKAVLEDMPGLRMALNHKMVQANAKISNDCEVAFFPPVTGG